MCSARDEFIEMATGGRRKLPTRMADPPDQIAELKRRLERCRRELACYRTLAPGWFFSDAVGCLVQVEAIEGWG